ncbi:MAG: class I SAM-dependent methyltransferase, partial [Bacteroidetes bacterium]|nr:class I SAM-dependent methyltransferase [Bacteroidota bacterium]
TPSMVKRIDERNQQLNLNLRTLVMDGHKLEFEDASFDKIILHLILAVIPDPLACIREAERVLKPGGRIAVFDKFVPTGKHVSLLRKLLNPITNLLVSDITRNFETILAHTGLEMIADCPADFKGTFRIISLKK